MCLAKERLNMCEGFTIRGEPFGYEGAGASTRKWCGCAKVNLDFELRVKYRSAGSGECLDRLRQPCYILESWLASSANKGDENEGGCVSRA